MKKASKLIRIDQEGGTSIYVRPEFVATVVVGGASEVVMTNYQTAHRCTQESALRVVEEMVDAPGPIILPSPRPQ